MPLKINMYDFLTTSMYFTSNFFIANTVDFLIENWGEIEHEYVILVYYRKLFEMFLVKQSWNYNVKQTNKNKTHLMSVSPKLPAKAPSIYSSVFASWKYRHLGLVYVVSSLFTITTTTTFNVLLHLYEKIIAKRKIKWRVLATWNIHRG